MSKFIDPENLSDTKLMMEALRLILATQEDGRCGALELRRKVEMELMERVLRYQEEEHRPVVAWEKS